ncbi:hypothetical protein Tco_1062953 [Tanacetum coccineum]
MCERHEANYIQSGDYQNQDSHNSFSRQSHHDRNDPEKSLTELNNDVKNDLEDFKRRIRSKRTVHWKLFARDDEQTDRTDPPPPQAHIEEVNAVFTRSGKSDYSLKILKDPQPPIIVNNKIGKDKPIKTSKRDYQVVKTNEYPFRGRMNKDFIHMDFEEGGKKAASSKKRPRAEPDEESVKRQKIGETSGSEAYRIFADMLKKFDRDELVKLWDLVKKRFSTTDPIDDKEKELWVELKRLFKPDNDDILWKL